MSRLTAPMAAVLAAAFAAPALANPVISLPPLLRDSDGIVISVLDVIDVYPYFTTAGGVGPGEVFYTFGGEVSAATGGATPQMGSVLLGGAELLTAGAAGRVLDIGGVSYLVEVAGERIWLRDIATGTRYAAARHIAPVTPDALGLVVNPASFALD